MDSDALRIFLYVIETGSLTGAATRAHVTQPALSRTIQMLEAELGVELFERTGRGMSPTPEGLELALRTRPLIEQLDRLPYQIRKDEISGPVTLVVTPSIGMRFVARIIETFIQQYPSAKLRTAVLLSGAMGPAIAQGKYDLGLLYSPHTTVQLTAEELWSERTYFVSGARSRRRTYDSERPTRRAKSRSTSIHLAEVLRAPLILPSSESGIFALLEFEAKKLDLVLRPALIIDSVQLALEMVRGGKYGIILTERALADIREKGLRATVITRPALRRSAQVASTELALARPVVRALWNHIIEQAKVSRT